MAELGRTLGEELLEPTLIYVVPVVEMIRAGLNIKALVHITGGGLLNLARVATPTHFVLDSLPPPRPIFSLIQKSGNISDEEMFGVFNMGIGFCLVIPEKEIDALQRIAENHSIQTQRIGYVSETGTKKVVIPAKRLIGRTHTFTTY